LDWAAEQATSVSAALRAVHVLEWPYGLSSVGFPRPVGMMNVCREELDSDCQAITDVFEAVSPQLGWNLHFCQGAGARFWFGGPKTPACSSSPPPANTDTWPAHRRAGSGGGVWATSGVGGAGADLSQGIRHAADRSA
jgi:hypothetical protein